jgi:hypothetical protein
MLRNYISYIVKNLLIPENKKFFYENKIHAVVTAKENMKRNGKICNSLL